MPGEKVAFPLGQGNTGLPMYGILYNPTQLVWNGTTFVTYSESARNLGAAAAGLAAEVGATGTYVFTVAAGVVAIGDYRIAWFRRLGGVGVYAITDTDYGSSYFRVGDTLKDLEAALLGPRDPNGDGSLRYANIDGVDRFDATPAEADGTFGGITRV